jgi:hypothetical protein
MPRLPVVVTQREPPPQLLKIEIMPLVLAHTRGFDAQQPVAAARLGKHNFQ